MTKKQNKTIKKEFEKMISNHLYTMADYSISSRKIDNEILATTGEEIKEEIWQFLHQTLQRFIEETKLKNPRTDLKKGDILYVPDLKIDIDAYIKGYNQALQDINQKQQKWIKENL